MITSVRLMLNKTRKLNNGSYPLVFQVIHKRRKRLLYTGYRIKEGAFDGQGEKIIMEDADSAFSVTDMKKMNRELRKLRNTINARIRQLERTTDHFTVEDVLSPYVHRNMKQQFYLLQYIDTQVERKKNLKKRRDGCCIQEHTFIIDQISEQCGYQDFDNRSALYPAI